MARGARVLSAQGEQVEDSEGVIVSNSGVQLWCSLPDVSVDGAALTQIYGDVKSFRADSSGPIEVVDFFGKRVCIVPPFSMLVVKAKNNDSVSLPSWEVFGPGYQRGGEKPIHVADLVVTNLAAAGAASASSFSAAYVQATQNAEVDALVDAGIDDLEALFAVSVGEVETKFNLLVAQLDLMGMTNQIDLGEGTDTLALAASAVGTWQLVDDSERLVTSARAFPVYCTLPDIVAGGAGALATLFQNIKFTSTGGSTITVRDFQHRHVMIVQNEETKSVRSVLAASTSGYQWQVIDEIDSELLLAPTRADRVEHLLCTLPSIAGAATNLASSFTDLDWETELDVVVDAQFDLLDTATALAFTEMETAFIAMDAVMVILTQVSS